MDDTTDRLKTLSPAEKELLYTIIKAHEEGKRLTNKELSKKLNKTEKTIKEQRGAIYHKLGIEGSPDEKETLLIEKIRKAWENFVIDPQEFGKAPSKKPSELILLVPSKPDTEPEPVSVLLVPSKPDTEPEPESERSPESRSGIFTIPRWVIALIAAAGIILVTVFIIRPQSPIQTPSNTDTPVNTEQPSTTATGGQGGIILTDTPPLPTLTPVPLTFTPVSPTFTPLPTETFTPEPTLTPSEIVLFEDNFDSNYLDPNIWVPHIGEIYAFNGMMTTDNNEAEVVIGDGTWNNIEVSFDIVEMLCYGNDINPFVGLRVDDSFNYFALVYSNCRIGWNTVANGRHNWIQGTYQSGDYNFKRMVVSVNGMTYQALDFPEYNTTDYNGGKVIIKLRKGMKIDNLKVVQLP